ncbi:MAG: hypothetical protein MRK02_07610 [Candidatus Scalindua sp.]|nr:hypothetical protein [Candidatus Scalindua sp.]
MLVLSRFPLNTPARIVVVYGIISTPKGELVVVRDPANLNLMSSEKARQAAVRAGFKNAPVMVRERFLRSVNRVWRNSNYPIELIYREHTYSLIKKYFLGFQGRSSCVIGFPKPKTNLCWL